MNFDLVRREVEFNAVRSRGPGGQNVNKVSSAALLFWNYELSEAITYEERRLIREKCINHINSAGEVYLRCDEFRDLERNKMRCFEKLYDLLLAAFHKPKKRFATKPTYSSKVRKKESKTRRSQTKKLRGRVHD